MATVIELNNRGDLFRLDVLEPGERTHRQIYTSPSLYKWMTDVLPTMQSQIGFELSPEQQVFALADVFCSGERLTVGQQFKPLTHITDGIWELKTRDIRVFGWFNKKDCFIGAVADDATKIKKHELYRGYANVTTKLFRERLDLDAPKFVSGDDPHAVVSNFDHS
jgi:hypothetical protein